MENGDLVPDSLVLDMIGERITKSDCAHGIILDGFPRTREQAEALDRYLSALDPNTVPVVVRLIVPQSALLKRLAARHICPVCGADYNRTVQSPRVPGKCDVDGYSLIWCDPVNIFESLVWFCICLFENRVSNSRGR